MTFISGASFLIISATYRSCSGFRYACISATTIASPPTSFARLRAVLTLSNSSGVSMLPSDNILSLIPKTLSRVTRGSGRALYKSYGSGILNLATSRTSSKFSVVKRQRFTPFLCMTVFTPTVVPWVK